MKKYLMKVQRTIKAINLFLNSCYKNYKKMKKKIKTIWLLMYATLCLTACGVTKATISKPAQGTQTTITITTNNPITTNVDPNIELKGKE